MTVPAPAIMRFMRSAPARFRASSAVGTVRQAKPITPILLASTLESDRSVLGQTLIGSEYVLVPAANWNTALNLAGHMAFSIILYDRCFNRIDWRLAVRRLASAWRIPTIVLLSETGEEELRNEVRASGGLEVLVRPFEASAVWRALHAEFRAS